MANDIIVDICFANNIYDENILIEIFRKINQLVSDSFPQEKIVRYLIMVQAIVRKYGAYDFMPHLIEFILELNSFNLQNFLSVVDGKFMIKQIFESSDYFNGAISESMILIVERIPWSVTESIELLKSEFSIRNSVIFMKIMLQALITHHSILKEFLIQNSKYFLYVFCGMFYKHI